MINWLIDQSVLLSLLIVSLILFTRLSNKALGATNTYAFWSLIPLSSLIGGIAHFVQPQVSADVYEVIQKLPLVSLQNQTSPVYDYANILVYGWLVGVFMISSILTINYRQFMKGIEKLEGNTHRGYKNAITHEGKTPFVIGLISPMLVVPKQFEKLYSPIQQQLLIRHEQIHIFRGDLWWNFTAIVLCSVFWFNPIMWIGYRYFRQQQEMACDQSVLHNHTMMTRKQYADAMITASASCRSSIFSPLHYSEVNTMKQRIHALKTHRKNKLFPVALIMMLSTTSLALAHTAIAGQKVGYTPSIIERVAPVYPTEAAKNNLEGYVTVSFDVSEQGTVSNVRVLASEPADVFNSSAIDAVKQWRYTPSDQPIYDALVQLDYKLSPDSTVVTPEYTGTEIVSVDSKNKKR